MSRSSAGALVLLVSILSLSARDKPKLVVGIVVDQMRADYLEKFGPYFAEGGFRKLLAGGTDFSNASYGYALTQTGPGHATIYTGVNPAVHGIVSNTWIDRNTAQAVYCVTDTAARGIGSVSKGDRSPSSLYTVTLGDMMTTSSRGEAKVVSLSIKDRSAVLPGGHSADLALWWDDESGHWISSSHYGESLPAWLEIFEKEHPAGSYLKVWDVFSGSGPGYEKMNKDFKEHNDFEEAFKGHPSNEFPYDFSKLAEAGGMKVLKSSPFGNSYTFDLARSAVVSEGLGKDDVPDLLALSFSSTDYIGHRFGPDSREVFETYLHFDRELAAFITFLEKETGEDGFVLFLTSDHGVMPNADYLKRLKLPATWMDMEQLKTDLNAGLQKSFGTENVISTILTSQIYLGEEIMRIHRLKAEAVQREVVRLLLGRDDIAVALSAHDLLFKEYSGFPQHSIQQGFNPKRSGDVIFIPKPMTGDAAYPLGADHGTPYEYDTHIPLILYGHGISRGKKVPEPADVTSITPTICRLLSVPVPPSCIAPVLQQALDMGSGQ